MSKSVHRLCFRWLRMLKIPVSSGFLKEKLLSHPDYPSLLCITDILDELEIENAAMVVDKDRLDELPVPFLAYIRGCGRNFILVTNKSEMFSSRPEFKKRWDGTIVVAEKKEDWINKENNIYLKNEKRRNISIAITILTVILFSTLSIFFAFSWLSLILFLTTLWGVTISILIVQQELGITNKITEQVCRSNENTDCTAVIKSKGFKFLEWVNWTDAGIIYFSSLLVSLMIASYSDMIQSLANILSLSALCSIPFMLFSIYYQWIKVKKWCPLCLATVGVLFLQLMCIIPTTLKLFRGEISYSSNTISLIIIFIIIAVIWLQLIKPLLINKNELTNNLFSLLRFKNTPEVFNSLVSRQRTADMSLYENDLQIGNPKAELQLIVACNPYCLPCAKAHKILHELVERNDLGLTIRFSIQLQDPQNIKLVAASYIFKILDGQSASYKRRILNDWYSSMDMDSFKKAHPIVVDTDVIEILKKNQTWSEANNISFTPTVFINGFELPKHYKIADLTTLINGIDIYPELNRDFKNNYMPV